MDITYLGHSSFKIKGKEANIITDPYSSSMMGIKFPKVEADVVTISHDHNDHNSFGSVEGNPLIIKGPGEYEVKGVNIRGLATFHDGVLVKDRRTNTIYRIEVEKVVILHCGDLGHKLDDKTLEILGQIDILMVPVGGTYTISASQAVEVVSQVEPSIIIPMHYYHHKLNQERFGKLAKVDDFLKEIDSQVEKQKKLNTSYVKLPEEQTVVVLE